MNFSPASLPEGLSYIMRPVTAGLAELRHMQDGTYSLADVALMNDGMDVDAENLRRARKAAEAGR